MSFEEFLDTLGNLHDCHITKFMWHPDEGTIELSFSDIYSNFEGLPEYPGPTPDTISLTGVVGVVADVNCLAGGLKVYEVSNKSGDDDFSEISIAFWPGGKIRISYREVHIPAQR